MNPSRIPADDQINILVLVKGEEKFVFLYEDHQKADVLRQVGCFAANPELNFSWYDAAVLSQKVRLAGVSGA